MMPLANKKRFGLRKVFGSQKIFQAPAAKKEMGCKFDKWKRLGKQCRAQDHFKVFSCRLTICKFHCQKVHELAEIFGQQRKQPHVWLLSFKRHAFDFKLFPTTMHFQYTSMHNLFRYGQFTWIRGERKNCVTYNNWSYKP